VEAVMRHDATVLAQLEAAFAQMQKPIAVRSSAVGEDSEAASFAGQHATILNVMAFSQLTSAIAEVVQSALSPSAMSYREKRGVVGAPSMGVVLQELFNPESAGVMFTRNPLNGVEERVIEAAWGLGEVVVAGLVIPDYYRISPSGEILERRVGDKDIELRLLAQGGTEEIEVPADKAHARILADDDLQNLHQLALQCESVYGKDLDMEWGLADSRLVLLQCRAITTRS
jgi:pyruvate,water dikinase